MERGDCDLGSFKFFPALAPEVCGKRIGECGGVPIDINEESEEEEVDARDGVPKGEVEGGVT
jgi:hypothetical protein